MTGKIVVFAVLGGLFFTIASMGGGHFAWWWLAGILMAASFLPAVRYGSRNLYVQFCAIALVLVVVGLWCTVSEGAVFFPEKKAEMLRNVVGGTVTYALIAALLTVLARVLVLSEMSEQKIETRSAWAVAPLVLVAGISYLIYYWVFGAIAFMTYTKQFYPHAGEQVAMMGVWFPVYQLGRGVLMTLAVLPLIYTLRMKRWQAALAVGIMVWIVGGGAPLLIPSPLMMPAQRYAHILEIMTQNVALGMTAVWLLRRKAMVVAAPRPTVAA